jgi:hypothetical protein
MLTLIGLLALAHADPLVHDGDPEAAARTAVALTGRTSWEPSAWSDLRAGPPRTLSGTPVDGTCRPDGSPMGLALDGLQGSVLYGDPDVEERYATARDAAVCNGASPEQLGRLGFLGGVAAADAGDDARAVERFRAARVWQPGLQWDPAFPSKIQPLFESATPPEKQALLEVAPREGATVDGREPGPVVAGEHLVRIGERGAWVATRGLPDALVWPAAFPPDGLTLADDPARRADLSRVLAAALGEGVAFGVVVQGRVWTGTTGRVDWTLHAPEPQPVPAPELPPPPAPRRRPVPVALLVGGVALAGVGGALAVPSWVKGSRGEWPDLDAHDAGRRRYWLGQGLVAAGTAVGGVGLVWTLGGR